MELRHCRLEQCGVGERCSGGEMERRRGTVDWERIDRRGDAVDSGSRGDMEWSYSSCRLWEKEVVERLSEGEIMLIGLD